MPPQKDDKIAEAQLLLQMQGNEKLDAIVEAISVVGKSLLVDQLGNLQKSDIEKISQGLISDKAKLRKDITADVMKEFPKKEDVAKTVLKEIPKPEDVAASLKADTEFIKSVKGESGENGKNGSSDTPNEIAEKINTLSKKISWKVLKDVPDMSRSGSGGAQDLSVYDETTLLTSRLRQLIFTGSAVTATQGSDGVITVNITGGGSGSTVTTPTGSVNGSNVTFTISASITPVWIVADGITYFSGAGYSYSSGVITMVSPPNNYIRVIS